MCFSNHRLEDPECRECDLSAPCLDALAGFGLSTFLDSCAQIIQIEKLNGGVPDWVLELDEKIVSEEDLETLKNDNPKLYRAYMKFNLIPRG